MSTILDLLYREYCRARLAEMRKQLLIPVTGDEILKAYLDTGYPAGPWRAGQQFGRWHRDESSPR